MVVEVPDSIGALDFPSHVLVNPVSGNCYVQTGYVLVFDPATRARLKKLDVEGDPVLCPEVGKVYFVSDTISVVDAQADTVVRRFAIPPFHPQEAVCSPASHKVYLTAGHEGMYSMLVLDTDSDSIVNSWVMHRPWANMVWDSVPDRVMFAAGSGASTGDTCWVGAIDCRTDSVVATAPVGMSWVDELAVNVAGRRLYCRGQDDTLGTVVRLLDLDSMEVYGALDVPPADAMQFNGATGQLFCRDGDSLFMVDGVTDSVRARVFVDGACDFCFSPVSGKVYVAAHGGPDSIVVLDTAGAPVAWLDLPESGFLYPYKIGAHPTRNEVYCAMIWDTVLVVDGLADTLAGAVEYLSYEIRQMVHNPAGNKLYAFDDAHGNLLVLGPDLRLQKTLQLGNPDRDICLVINPALNRLYAVDDYWMWVVDCNSDSVLGSVRVPFVEEAICLLHPTRNKLYVFPEHRVGGSQAYVYDCLRDSVVRTMVLPYATRVPCACYHPRSDKIYFACISPPTVCVLDPVTDSIVDSLRLGDVLTDGSMLANTEQNVVYFGNSSTDVLYTVDVTDNSLVDWDSVDANLDTLFWNPAVGKLYVVNEGGSIRVLDCSSGTLGDELPFHLEDVGTMNLRNSKLYMGSDLSRQVDVMDCRYDSIVASLPFHATRARAMAWNQIDNRVYASRGNKISVYRDDPVGVEEQTRMRDEGGRMSQTIVRRVLRLGQSGDRPSSGGTVPVLLDITGRKVMDLEPGENDVRSVAPGVYFIAPSPQSSGAAPGFAKPARGEEAGVRKVVIQK
jgi:DNA-binding beta-propeller fold protein YncE